MPSNFSQHFSQDWLREPVAWLNRQGQVRDINLAMDQVFGYSKEDLLKRHLWEIDRGDLQIQWSSLWESMMNHRFVKVNSIFAHQLGHPLHVEIYCQHYWLDGKDYMCAMFRDVSEVIRYQEQLRASQFKFEKLLKTVPLPIAVFSQEGQLFMTNYSFEKIFGKMEIQRNFQDLLSQWLWNDTEKTRLLPLFWPVLSGEIQQIGPELVICKNHQGEARQMELHVTRSGNEFILCLEDLTDRLSAESELRKLSQAVHQSSASIVITNTKAEIEYVNPAFLKLSGYSWEEVKGANPRVLQSGFTPKSVFVALWNTITKGKTWTGEFQNKRKDGSFYWEMVNISPIKNQSGEITHYVAVKDDATTRKHAELLLIEAKRNAEDASLAKSMFLANMSHEIRTPMNGIIGFTDLLLDMVKDPDQHSYLEMIHRSSEALLKIINDILDISKIESNKVELFNVVFDLQQTISDVINLAHTKLRDDSVKIHWENANLPQWVHGDELRFRQVLSNILGNAVKFTTQGSVVLTNSILEQRDQKLHLEFHITDTGPGIPADKLETIFEPFQQADNSITRKFGGTGLGLTLSRKLVQLMGGEIQLKSEEKKGSCFSFDVIFGSVDLESVVPVLPDHEESDHLERKLHLLLCEDNLINQKLAVKILESLGCAVELAGDGATGVEKGLINFYDVILMDLQMPIMDGLTATKKLRSFGCKTPIVAMTANAMQGDREICLASGMNDYVSKPIRRKELIAALRRVMKNT